MNTKGELTSVNKSRTKTQLFENIVEALNDARKARMYLAKELGEEIFNWLLPDELQELESGLLKSQNG